MLECARQTGATPGKDVAIKLHDPAGLTALELVMRRAASSNRVELELTNGSNIALATGAADRFDLQSLLISRRDMMVGDPTLGLKFDFRSGRIWLHSTEFGSAALLFLRRWELQTALGDLYGDRPQKS